MKYSIIIPLYKCSKFINELNQRLQDTLNKITNDFEIIFINDASPENDWEIVKEISKSDEKIKCINLSRNFGQHYAITAGLENASGDWVVVMDGDLQDQPEEIINLYNKTKEGYDIVFAQRGDRQDGFFKKMSSKIFYRLFSYLTETEQDGSIANFGIYKKDVIVAILKMKDHIKYFPTMSQWVGFEKTAIHVEHGKRNEGNSSYSLSKLLSLAFNNMISFSNKPLKIMIKFGFLIVIISIIFALYFLIKYLKGEIEIIGYTSLIISIWFLSGIIIFILGVIGIYLGKTFDKVKERPLFIVKNSINLK